MKNQMHVKHHQIDRPIYSCNCIIDIIKIINKLKKNNNNKRTPEENLYCECMQNKLRTKRNPRRERERERDETLAQGKETMEEAARANIRVNNMKL